MAVSAGLKRGLFAVFADQFRNKILFFPTYNLMDATVPLSLDPLKPTETDDGRLWIGNLDPRINEYQLLKLVRSFGDIDKFDLMFHRSGHLAGQPRGFAFVTYKKRQDALKAQEQLHGRLVGCRNLSVKWAKNTTTEEIEKPKPELGIAVLAGTTSKSDTKLSKKTAIQSIEAKLKMMENKKAGDDFVINKLAAKETPILAQYQTKQCPSSVKKDNSWRRRHPYHKKR